MESSNNDSSLTDIEKRRADLLKQRKEFEETKETFLQRVDSAQRKLQKERAGITENEVKLVIEQKQFRNKKMEDFKIELKRESVILFFLLHLFCN